MHLFLPLALLLIHGCSGLNLPNAVDVTTDAVNIMNKFRQQVAGGTVLIDNYLNLPSSQSIFQLKPSAVLNSTARLNILNCNAKSDNIPAGHSISIFTTSHLPSSENANTVLNSVLKSWENETTSSGLDLRDILTYNNTHLKNFANMVYYKSTEVGCYYNKCNTAGQTTHAVACVFNMLPQMDKPLYVWNSRYQGCNSDESCSEQLAGSTCITSGPYAGLCDPGEKTFAGTPLNMTVAVRNHIIDMHNYRRSRLAQGLVPNGTTGKKLPAGTDIALLNYNMGLERAAQAYANNCPTGLSSKASRPGTGEIYQSLPSSNKLAIMDVISMALKASWHPVWIVGFNDTLEFVQSLEEKPNAPIMFTQMAWGKTQKVGCGAARCSRNTTVICRYSPSGNIVGQKLYTPGKTCSNCPNGCTKAYLYKGLCID